MKQLILIAVSSFLYSFISAQGIGIGTANPNPSAALDITSVTQGILVPRMTTAQRTIITSPATGLLVYDMTSQSFWFRSNTQWIELIDTSNTVVHKNGGNIYMGMIGNTGIGTSTPTSKLEVKTPPASPGITHNDGNVILRTATSATSGILSTITNHSLQLNANDLVNQLTLATNGNVGIGLSSPSASLEVARGTGINGTAVFKGTTHATHFNYSTDENTVIRGGKANSHVILNDISGLGNVGIGTGLPLQKLHVEGGAYVSGNVGIGLSSPSASLEVARGTGINGAAMFKGATYDSHFCYSTDEHTFIRGGKPNSTVILNDLAGLGNVGIGTSTPVQKLHVEGSSYISQKLGIGMSTPNAQLQLGNTIANRKLVLWEADNNDHEYYGLGINEYALRYQVSALTFSHVFFAASSPSTSNELMRIQGDGKVGIGNATPTERLNVGSFGTESNTYMQIGTSGGNQYKAGIKLNHESELKGWTLESDETQGTQGKFFIKRHTENSEEWNTLTVDGDSGNIGIGVTNPGAMLEIARGFSPNGSLQVNGTSYTSHFNYGFPEDTYIRGGKAGGKVIINDFGDPGNVGIGVTNPGAMLEIARGTAPSGSLQVNGTSYTSNFNYGTPEDTYIRGGKAGGKVIINDFGALGNVGIGTATPTEKLAVNGNVAISGSLKIGYVRVQSLIVGVDGLTNGSASCNCPPGYVVLGGGFQLSFSGVDVIKSQPNGNTSWFVYVYNRNGFSVELIAEGICARLAP